MCSKVLSGLPGLYSPDADGTALVVTTTYASGHGQISSRGRKRCGLRTPTLHDGDLPSHTPSLLCPALCTRIPAKGPCFSCPRWRLSVLHSDLHWSIIRASAQLTPPRGLSERSLVAPSYFHEDSLRHTASDLEGRDEEGWVAESEDCKEAPLSGLCNHSAGRECGGAQQASPWLLVM